ncbi:hypothetical protein P7C71_g2069, partial [Lecanoromycetidae sp. Uapishka_2]
MGIPGIYKELGPGERIALAKIAVEHIEKTGKPLRLAIDISIWQFQIQSGQGGKNPGLRTLYYRLLRLLALSIHPLFVFDGPERPSFKRGKIVSYAAACMGNVLIKELLKRFGFPYHTAPGEAEAECALLQRQGIVDAVLNMTVLSYYQYPAVSSPEKVSKLRSELQWNHEIDTLDLRMFVGEELGWQKIGGARKFVRGLAPALLSHRLYDRSTRPERDQESIEKKERDEFGVVKAICGRRKHWNTDGMQELRIAYLPADIAGLDLDAEEKDDGSDFNADVSGEENLISGDEEATERSKSPTRRRGVASYDPNKIEKIWVLETYVKLGVPVMTETWEEQMRNPKQAVSRKTRGEKAVGKCSMKAGAMDRFVKISKAAHQSSFINEVGGKKPRARSPSTVLLASTTAPISISPSKKATFEFRKVAGDKPKKQPSTISKQPQHPSSRSLPSPKIGKSNPWTLSRRPSDTFSYQSPTRYSALGIYAPDDPEILGEKVEQGKLERACQQSLASPPASPPPRKRHSRPNTPTSESEALLNDNLAVQDSLDPSPELNSFHTPRYHDPSKPTPRKNRSPLQAASEIQPSNHLRTPTSICSQRSGNVVTAEDEELLTSKRVNRRLDFTSPTPTSALNVIGSDTPELPSPSAFIPVKSTEATYSVDSSPTSLSKEQVAPTQEKRARKLIALRESLQGAWKHLESWEAGRPGKGVFSGVEVLDLTG